MTRKRPQIRGRGADAFTPSDKPRRSPRQPKATPVHKMTFYLPVDLDPRLDELYLAFRGRYRRISKSAIVAAALEVALEQHKKNPNTGPLAKRVKQLAGDTGKTAIPAHQ